MKRFLVAAVLALSVLPTSTAAAYVPKHGHACRSGYEAKTVKRHHHKTRECVKVTKPVTLTAPTVVRANIDPSYTQDPSNPLIVTFDYSASDAGVTLPDGTITLTIDEHGQAASSYQCAANVGGVSVSASCTVKLSGYGLWDLAVT